MFCVGLSYVPVNNFVCVGGVCIHVGVYAHKW